MASEERKLRRRAPRQAAQQSADDRRAGAAGARNQCQRLEQPELHRIQVVELIHVLHALPCLRRSAHRMMTPPTTSAIATDTGLNSTRLDLILEQQAEHRERHEGDKQIEDEAARHRVAVQGERGVQQLLPEFPAHREDRGALDDDEVAVDRRAFEAEQATA